ncbi:MAG: glycosyltransferase [Candidatus Methylomirabilis oxygeniifera]|nr:MAG: glycosyltransferase [Candidatus Methylomirabilis oxyfera]
MMIQSAPKVSVIVPLYNHELYVEEALRSVLEQSFRDLELVIVNDGSTDGSEAVVERIDDRRIRYYRQENRGAHDALNRGIGLARGAYIAILNSDDLYYPGRIADALNILERDPEVSAVFTYIELINAQGESLGVKRGAEDNWSGQSAESSFREEHDTVLDLLAGNFLHTTSNLICRREVFDRIGLFANLRYTHDYEFCLRLCARSRVAMIQTPLLRYRFHQSNTLSEDAAASQFETGMVLADFFLTYDVGKMLGEGPRRFQRLAKLYNSVRTYETDRIIILLLVLGFKGNWQGKFWEVFAADQQNPFREACIDSLTHTRDLCTVKETLRWQQGQTEHWWARAEELRHALEQREIAVAEFDKRSRESAEELRCALEQRDTALAELEARSREQHARIEELRAKEAVLNEVLASQQWKWLQKLNRVRSVVRRVRGIGQA